LNFPGDLNPPSLRGVSGRSPYCRSRVMSSHTALEYCSQPLSEIWVQPHLSQVINFEILLENLRLPVLDDTFTLTTFTVGWFHLKPFFFFLAVLSILRGGQGEPDVVRARDGD
jgi:hypothetical protein